MTTLQSKRTKSRYYW